MEYRGGDGSTDGRRSIGKIRKKEKTVKRKEIYLSSAVHDRFSGFSGREGRRKDRRKDGEREERISKRMEGGRKEWLEGWRKRGKESKMKGERDRLKEGR